jgi:hypothetical protein
MGPQIGYSIHDNEEGKQRLGPCTVEKHWTGLLRIDG